MHAHFVLAHPEPASYNAQLVRVGGEALTAAGWTHSVSDLYAMGFDPAEGPSHFADPLDAVRFDTQAEQRHASDHGTLPAQVTAELARLDRADLVVLQYPMWWHMPPAMLKGWFDRVFAYGAAYTAKMRFENGRFAGKRALLSVTVAPSRATYGHDGRSGDIDLMLWPVNVNLAYVGFTVLQPFVAYGVEAGLRYSDPEVIRSRLEKTLETFRSELSALDDRPVVPFNKMSEWGPDGRLAPGAPVYSPFIRRKETLELG